MKKMFPVIITLIVISLLGIIFVQVQWINSAMLLKREKYDQDLYYSLQTIKDSIQQRKDRDNYQIQFNSPFATTESSIPTKTVYTNFELRDLIRTELRRKNIRQDFEYAIINQAALPTMYSTGFIESYLDNVNTRRTPLTPIGEPNYEILYLYIIEQENYLQNHFLLMTLGALFFTGIIITAFVLTLRIMFAQKKLSEIKSDFINNMTHEFKTPIATINLASDALNNQKVLADGEKIKYYTSIIKEENTRMNKQVEKILHAAQLEKEELKMTLKEINVHDVIKKITENTELQMNEIQAKYILDLKASQFIIMADEVHFSNIIFNLIDNAIKYSKENLEIEIRTKNIGSEILISIQDNGIGMNKEVRQHIFEKFYRAHTGNKHNVKGFGLGLTYVKNVVDAHQATIDVKSTLNVGSTFILSFKTA
ncbi:MAG: HAMP domain-containing histidine kinase [Chitinophagaceae bacterium]|nr:HAMP domain-containing histidine kinase [Chitinophagaceae bacterium]